MSDLIDRQAVIDAISTWDKFGVDERGRIVRWYEGLEPYVHWRDVVTAIVNLPSVQAEIDKQELIRTITAGITATNTKDVYSCGMRNGMRWCKALLEKDAPKFEKCTQPEQPWIPFKLREMTEEERKEYPSYIDGMWDEPTPDDEQIILVTDGTIAWTDKFLIDDDGGCYLGSGVEIVEGMAWVPCPELYKPKEGNK